MVLAKQQMFLAGFFFVLLDGLSNLFIREPNLMCI